MDFSHLKEADPAGYVEKLKTAMQTLRAISTRQSSRPHSYVSKDLASASHVFVRHGATRSPLQLPYDGPFKVIERSAKYFTLEIRGRQDTVSVDRLKPARLDCQLEDAAVTPSITCPPPTTSSSQDRTATGYAPCSRSTRSGRHVHWPKHLAEFVP